MRDSQRGGAGKVQRAALDPEGRLAGNHIGPTRIIQGEDSPALLGQRAGSTGREGVVVTAAGERFVVDADSDVSRRRDCRDITSRSRHQGRPVAHRQGGSGTEDERADDVKLVSGRDLDPAGAGIDRQLQGCGVG